MRFRAAWLIPAFLLVTAGFLELRKQQISSSLIDLSARRKPFDNALIGKITDRVFVSTKTPSEFNSQISQSIANTHRSTLISIYNSDGSKVADNRSTLKASIPESVVDEIMLRVSLDGNRNETIEINKKPWNIDLRKTFVGDKTKFYTIVLITNLHASIEDTLNENYRSLELFLVGYSAIVSAMIFFYSGGLGSLSMSVRASRIVKVPWWWPFETAMLGDTYNAFLEAERQAKQMIAQSTCGQMVVESTTGQEAIITEPNDALAEMTGYSKIELDGLPLNAICPTSAHEFHRGVGVIDDKKRRYVGTNAYPKGCPHLGKSASITVGVDRQVEVIAKNGRTIQAILGVYLLSSDGRTHNYAGVLTDVTALTEATKEIDKFHRNNRHDLLSAAGGALNMHQELVNLNFDPGEPYREPYDLMVKKIKLMHRLIEGTGKYDKPLKIIPSSLKDVVGDTKIMFSSNTCVSFLDIREGIIINIDRDAFVLSVLNNLITNAVKYSPVDRQNVTIGIKEKIDSVVLYVKDEGFGLSKPEIEQVLNNYGQNARLRPEIEGSGTGLSTVQKVLKLHGLELKVKSEKGTGSLFYIDIPKVEKVESTNTNTNTKNE